LLDDFASLPINELCLVSSAISGSEGTRRYLIRACCHTGVGRVGKLTFAQLHVGRTDRFAVQRSVPASEKSLSDNNAATVWRILQLLYGDE
jgi:hypothetical protein